jgi:hypothetical protein
LEPPPDAPPPDLEAVFDALFFADLVGERSTVIGRVESTASRSAMRFLTSDARALRASGDPASRVGDAAPKESDAPTMSPPA